MGDWRRPRHIWSDGVRFLYGEKCRHSLLLPYLYHGPWSNIARSALPSPSQEGTREAVVNATSTWIAAMAFDLSDIAAVTCGRRHYENSFGARRSQTWPGERWRQ
jgi:hypothetical protein